MEITTGFPMSGKSIQPADKDYSALATSFRRAHGLTGNRPVVAYVGQALTEHPAYIEVVKHVADAAVSLRAFVIYHPDPLEWAREREWELELGDTAADEMPHDVSATRHIFAERGGYFIVTDPRTPIDQVMAASDIVVSIGARPLDAPADGISVHILEGGRGITISDSQLLPAALRQAYSHSHGVQTLFSAHKIPSLKP